MGWGGGIRQDEVKRNGVRRVGKVTGRSRFALSRLRHAYSLNGVFLSWPELAISSISG